MTVGRAPIFLHHEHGPVGVYSRWISQKQTFAASAGFTGCLVLRVVVVVVVVVVFVVVVSAA